MPNDKTRERILTVLENMAEEVRTCDKENLAFWKEQLQGMLDDAQIEDFFGTEAQHDPRGDFREGNWSMDRVQGIDK